MDRKKVIEQLRAFTPGLAAVVVAGCVASSLSGYQAPVYASDKSVKADETEKDKAVEKETKAEIQGAKGAFDLADGTYQGTGTGFSGDVTVSVQIKDKTIVAINVISTSDDAAFFNRAKAVIDKIIQSQKLDVDVVSGATYSSNGIINAVKNALTGKKDSGTTGASLSGAASSAAGSKSVEKVTDAAAYKDGTYYGTGTGFAGPLTVKVVISDGKIASIEITKTDDGDSFIQKASGLISNIVSSQSTNVDTVSGATYSSVGIIEAVRDALSQAAVDSSGSNGENAGNNKNQNDKKNDQNGQNNSGETVTGKFPYKDGIYYGTAEGYQGDITVAVVLKNKTITSILVTEQEDDTTFFNRALNVVDKMVEQQKTDVDTVSGATYSSKGLIGAVKNALEDAKRITNGQKPLNDKNGSGTDNKDNKDNKEESIDVTKLDEFIAMAEKLNEDDYTPESWALLQQKLQEAKQLKETLTSTDKQEKVDKASASINAAISGLVKKGEEEPETVYINGDYTASVECQPDEEEEFDPYEVSLAVTVFNDKIISVSDVSWSDKSNNWYMKRAMNGASNVKGILTQITEAGTLDQIDTVSGATCSSKALIEACQTALDSAKR